MIRTGFHHQVLLTHRLTYSLTYLLTYSLTHLLTYSLLYLLIGLLTHLLTYLLTLTHTGVYYAPEPGTLNNYRDYVRTLPFNEGPEVFGLHDNANISSAISETNLLLETALSLQPRSDGGSGKGWGEILAELSQDISNRIPAVFDIEKALILFPVKYEESMNTVLTQVIE